MENINESSTFDQLMLSLTKPNLEKKISFFRLLAITQKAGLGIRESILTILKSESHNGMKKILEDIIIHVNKGLTLATAMKKHTYFFSVEEIELVRSSETIGNMPETLEEISKELENYQNIISKVKNAMTYPVMVLLFAIAAVVILLIKVIPTIVDLFPDKSKLPGITIFMINASDFVQHSWFFIVILVGFLAGGYILLYRFFLPFKIFIDGILLKIPIVGIFIKDFNLYRFSKLLGDFYNAGVSPTVALDQISDILKNYHYKTKISNIRKDIEMGLRFTESIEGSPLFDPILVQIIGVGEDTGDIGIVLNKMGEFYREEIAYKIEGLMKMIEPILMGFIAVVVGVIVASIFLPLGDLVGQIGG